MSGNKTANLDLVTGQLAKIAKTKPPPQTSPAQRTAGRKQPAVATSSFWFTPWWFQNLAPPPQLKNELMLINQVSQWKLARQVRQVPSMKANTVCGGNPQLLAQKPLKEHWGKEECCTKKNKIKYIYIYIPPGFYPFPAQCQDPNSQACPTVAVCLLRQLPFWEDLSSHGLMNAKSRYQSRRKQSIDHFNKRKEPGIKVI